MEQPDYPMVEQQIMDDNAAEPLLEPVADEPEPMEGVAAITEVTPVEEDKPEDDPLAGEYLWEIPNFSKLPIKHYSETFEIGGYPWRVLIFPRGNKCEHLSLYLDVADAQTQPPGWSRTANFSLVLVNQLDEANSVSKGAEHHFHASANDWGFTQFVGLSELKDPAKGLIVNDRVLIKIKVKVQKLIVYDSKAETGFVGLKNQGATCYMNSLLQTLYNINYFRQAVYHMPTTEEELPDKSIPLALQSLFYKLQFGNCSVSTKDLTKSFGWDSYESLMQHDVQELNRVLCEKLEEKMKGTKVEGVINKLFEGHTYNFIECVNIEYKSTRKESFMDLQLDVKGCKNVYDSFDKYTEVELLEGANQYKAEGQGLQDARKGVLFDSLPPVLQLQLKRFEYDFQRDAMVKINDRYEFPEELDLDAGDHKYLSPNADKTVRNKYRLHSVLVHSGGVHGGHYYAFERPDGEQWLKFDDDKVTKEEAKRALQEQYGGEDELNSPAANQGYNAPLRITKYSNAYMLVYVRESDWDTVMCNVTEGDISEHVRARLKAEQEEKERRRKEKMEAHLYTIIRVATDADMAEQIGRTRHFDLVDHEKVRVFRVPKQKPLSELKAMVAAELNVPPEAQRYWLWARRQNNTFRPSRSLLPEEEEKEVSSIRESHTFKVGATADLKLYLETPEAPATALHVRSKMEMLLFFKHYDPTTQQLRYAGRMFAHKHTKVGDLHGLLRSMVDFPHDTPLELYEEVKFEPNVMCEPLERKVTLANAQLEDGDIICFQAVPTKDEATPFPRVDEYLDYVKNRQTVTFKKLENYKGEGFTLELSKGMRYDDVVGRLADALGVMDPLLLRLTQHNCYSHNPKPTHIKYRGYETLADMLTHYNQTMDVLYYEVLDMPLPELERLKTLKVFFHNERGEEVSAHHLRLPKEATVDDVLAELRDKQLGPEYADRKLRMVEVFLGKLFKVFEGSERIDNINDTYWVVRAEAIPEDELSLTDDDRILFVSHCSRDSAGHVNHNFGDPFMFRVDADEKLSSVRARLRQRLGVPDEEFAKWQLCVVHHMRPAEVLDDDEEVVASRFPKPASPYAQGGQEPYLGLDHPDTNPRRHHHNTRMSQYERPIKIYS